MPDRNMIPTPAGYGELWMGGYPSPDDTELQDFNLVVNTTFEAEWPRSFGAGLYIRLPLDDRDDELNDAGTAERVRAVASLVAGALTMGWRVLVHCGAGLNRSGVVSARSLMYVGVTYDGAIDSIRAYRSADALFNRGFVRWLSDEAGLPLPTADTSMFADRTWDERDRVGYRPRNHPEPVGG